MLNAVPQHEGFEASNHQGPEQDPTPEKSPLEDTEISRQSTTPELSNTQEAEESLAKPKAAVTLSINNDGVATLCLGQAHERVITFSQERLESLQGMLDEVEELIAHGQINSLVISSPSRKTFCAGADIKEFAQVSGAEMASEVSRKGQELFARIRNLPVTTVAAVEGAVMGGGFEICLNCDYIVAADSPATKMALPEVQLGILPAWSGNSLLPHKIGLPNAMKVMTVPKPMDATYAHKLGIVDHVTDSASLMATAEAIASGELAPKQAGSSFISRMKDSFLTYTAIGRSVVKGKALAKMKSDAGEKFIAPYKILDVALETAANGVEAGLKKEAEEFGALFASPQREELVKLFLTMDEAKRNNGVARSERLKGQEFGINSLAVIGAAGIMGGGISSVSARGLGKVYVTDMSAEGAAATIENIKEKAEASSSMKEAEVAALKENISQYASADDLLQTPPDAVIEAIVERTDIKVKVFREYQEKFPDAILMTNTSSLSVNEMQKELDDPSKLIGVHFFNPAEKMPLVEIIIGEQTSQDTVDKTIEYIKQLGKVPVLIQKECPGFIVNRLLFTAFDEFGRLLNEGNPVSDIDKGAESLAFQMGGGKTLDLVGLRLALSVGKTLGAAYDSDNTDKMSEGFQKLLDLNRAGQKDGGGFYSYDERGKPQAFDALEALGIEKAKETDRRESGLRYTARLSVEAVKVALEGIGSERDIELAMQMGAGMIPLGPFRFIENYGSDKFIDLCDRLAGEYGPRFELTDDMKTYIKNISSETTKA